MTTEQATAEPTITITYSLANLDGGKAALLQELLALLAQAVPTAPWLPAPVPVPAPLDPCMAAVGLAEAATLAGISQLHCSKRRVSYGTLGESQSTGRGIQDIPAREQDHLFR